MNRQLSFMLLIAATCVTTGCNQSGTSDRAKGDGSKQAKDGREGNPTKKTEVKKAEDRKPPDAKPTEEKAAKDVIAGRWEGTDDKGRKCAVEFTAFGTVKAVKPDNGAGKYLLAGPDQLDMEFSVSGTPETAKYTVAVSKGELTLTSKDGKPLDEQIVSSGKYKRVEAFSAGVKSPKELIIGRWKNESKGSTDVYEFKRDGTYTQSFYSETFKKDLISKGKYAFKNPDMTLVELRLEIDPLLYPDPKNAPPAPVFTFGLVVTGDELEFVGKLGTNSTRHRRITAK